MVWATFNADRFSIELKEAEANDDDEVEDVRFRFSATVKEFQFNFNMFLFSMYIPKISLLVSFNNHSILKSKLITLSSLFISVSHDHLKCHQILNKPIIP